ncbi:proline dehydrogenase [Striga asiatica]|uniref:Proline dehydrogenase n=1 Tax=Striga asiatica TaxID=4170 RepID=A0A5A7QVI9_STRAF|nr:proline dehydrogenase [Striga asiatica]
MISRSVRPKHVHSLRRLNSAAVSLPWADGKSDPPARIPDRTPPADGCPVDLTDTKSLFASLSTGKLIRSAATLHLASIGPMVDIGTWVMGSRLMEVDLVRRAVLGFTERTFYGHFCGGADLSAARETVERLWFAGLNAMMDYGLEHASDNESCDCNADVIVDTINSSRTSGNSAVSFVVVKLTAIFQPKLLRRVSDLLRWEHRDTSLHLPWKLKSLPILSNISPLYHTPTKPQPLTLHEEHDLQLARARLDRICRRAVEADIPLLIDAEDTSIQPAIDHFAYSAAVEHSGREDGSPIIFNTIQAYLKDSKERLVAAKEAADQMGVPVGFKLVRGAYLSSERMLADRLGVKSPVHDSIGETHTCFDSCADFLLEEIGCGSGYAVLATHNVESDFKNGGWIAGKMAASKAVNLGIRKNSPYLHFAQLYGMAEALSFGLKNAGFNVSKYLPFGPVEQIMPYLLRRAEENRGLLAASSLDRQLMSKEIIRRVASRSIEA